MALISQGATPSAIMPTLLAGSHSTVFVECITPGSLVLLGDASVTSATGVRLYAEAGNSLRQGDNYPVGATKWELGAGDSLYALGDGFAQIRWVVQT